MNSCFWDDDWNFYPVLLNNKHLYFFKKKGSSLEISFPNFFLMNFLSFKKIIILFSFLLLKF